MKTTIYLIRHGTTDWNETGRYQGSSDIPLNKKGLGEAIEVGKVLSKISFNTIYSSPLIRAKRTAEEIAKHHTLPITLVDELKERSYGSFEGLTFEEIQNNPVFQNMEKGEWYLKGAPDGESFDDATQRVGTAINLLVKPHINQTIGIVAHGGVIKSIGFHIGHLGRKELPRIVIPNAKPLMIEYLHQENLFNVIDFPFSMRK